MSKQNLTLSDTIQRMQSNSESRHDIDFTAHYMRLAAQAAIDAIVPEEKGFGFYVSLSAVKNWNACRADVIAEGDKFMGETK